MVTKYKPHDGYVPFCDNPICDMHVFPSAAQTEVLKDNSMVIYSQRVLPNGKRLCSVCLTAVEVSKTHLE